MLPASGALAAAVGGGGTAAQQAEFQRAFDEAGGSGEIGNPTSDVHRWGSGCTQDFSGGRLRPAAIMQKDCTGRAYAVTGTHLQYLLAVGGPDEIGYPDNPSHAYGNGWTQDFRGGRRSWTLVMYGNATGRAHGLFGAMRDNYFAVGGPGAVGYPTTNEYSWNAEVRQDFEKAAYLWNSIDGVRRLGQFAVGQSAPSPEAFRVAYRAAGGAGELGSPTSVVHSWGAGCVQDFSGGRLTPAAIMQKDCAGPAFAVTGAHLSYLLAIGGPDEIGYPANASHRFGAGWTQDFRGGRRTWTLVMNPDGLSRAWGVFGAVRDYYLAHQGPDGRYGQPGSDEEVQGGYVRQLFQAGAIGWSAASGAFDWDAEHPDLPGDTPVVDDANPDPSPAVSDAWAAAFARAGGAQAMGGPINNVHEWWDGCIQDFTGGTERRSALMQPGCTGDVFVVRGAVWQFVERRHTGGQGPKWLGYPSGDAKYYPSLGGWIQTFVGGLNGYTEVRRGDNVGVAWGVTNPILGTEVSGGVITLGFPTSAAYSWGGETRQDFEYGTILHNPTSGGRVVQRDAKPLPDPGASTPCAQVLFVGLRGSGQTELQGDALGPQVMAAWEATRKVASELGLTVQKVAVSYPADAVVPGIVTPGYYRGEEAGANNLVRLLGQRVDCNTERLVLSGFSQGAMSVEEALHDLAGSDPDQLLDRVDAVLLIASPRFKASNVYSRGPYDPEADGMALALETLPQSLWDRTISYCGHRDSVCEGLQFAGHANYPDPALEGSFAAQVRFGLHSRAGLGPALTSGLITAGVSHSVSRVSLSGGATHTYSAGTSWSSAAPITKYEWDFGDDGTFELATKGPSVVKDARGAQRPRLRVTDAAGNSAEVVAPAVGTDSATPVPPSASLASLDDGRLNVAWSSSAVAAAAGAGEELLPSVVDIRLLDGDRETVLGFATTAKGHTRLDVSDLRLKAGATIALGVPGRSLGGTAGVATVRVMDGSVPAFDRVSGPDRETTAIEAARRLNPIGATQVVIASSQSHADALAAVPLAARLGAPLLLVGGRVTTELTGELRRLAPDTIIVVGGSAAVSEAVRAQLATFAHVRRVAGTDRFATAALVARELGSFTGAVVVQGVGPNAWADAVSGGSLAAQLNVPLLLVGDHVTPVLRDALAGVTEVVIVGGSKAVAPRVETELRGLVPMVTRLGGADRQATSALAARRAIQSGANPRAGVVATGSAFPDALVGAVLAARTGGWSLLAGGRDYRALADVGVSQLSLLTVMGGPRAVSDAEVARVHAQLLALDKHTGDGTPVIPVAVPQQHNPPDVRGPADPHSLTAEAIAVPAAYHLRDLTAGSDALWALTFTDDAPGLLRISHDGTSWTPIELPTVIASDLVYASGAIWVTAPRRLLRIDEDDLAITEIPIDGAQMPSQLVLSGGVLYVADEQGTRLYAVDPETEAVTGSWLQPTGTVFDMAVGAGWAYFVMYEDGEEHVAGIELTGTGQQVTIDPAGDLDHISSIAVDTTGRVLVVGWEYPAPNDYNAAATVWSGNVGSASLVPTRLPDGACFGPIFNEAEVIWLVETCAGELHVLDSHSLGSIARIQLDQAVHEWSSAAEAVQPAGGALWVLTSVVGPQYLWRIT